MRVWGWCQGLFSDQWNSRTCSWHSETDVQWVVQLFPRIIFNKSLIIHICYFGCIFNVTILYHYSVDTCVFTGNHVWGVCSHSSNSLPEDFSLEMLWSHKYILNIITLTFRFLSLFPFFRCLWTKESSVLSAFRPPLPFEAQVIDYALEVSAIGSVFC